MAAWLIAALALMRGIAPRVLPLARRAAFPAAVGVAGGVLGAQGLGIPGVDLFPGGGDGALAPRRRRRRRALTASDRADIAFIESILGKAAGKSFAMIIATRT